MNLSHAASILLYLCSRHGAPAPAEQPGASLAMIKRLEVKMEEALLAAEFLNPQAPQHVLTELSRSLVRGQLTEREAQVWLAAFEHLRRKLSPSNASK
jgi:tRNA/rRNA methyltransferase